MKIRTGQKAPDFTLYESPKEKITLSDFEGNKNVLLLFFPLAFTSVCTKELCDIRDNPSQYYNDTTQVLGISVDSVYSLAKFKEELHYPFPFLSDFNKTVSVAYGSLYDSFSDMGMLGVSKRSAFVIDRQGIVQYAEILEKAWEVPDFEKIDIILKKLQ